MCQFRACQPWNERERDLFQPISVETAATVRAGWWAYQYQYAHYVDRSHHGSYGVVSPWSDSPADASAHGHLPTYDYGYGTDF